MHYGTIITARDLLRPGPPRDWVVIDCRFELADPAWGESAYRLGHIPGALNRPYTENLRRNETFWSAAVLRAQWTALLGGRAPGSVVHMCGSGVTACHNLLAMEIAGLSGSRLYAGSWSEWIADSARPVAVCAC